MGRTKPIVSADYIVGITDGEGCFYVNTSRSSAYRSGWHVSLHFHLKLQEADKELLWSIRNTLRCGNVYFQNEKRQNHAQCYRYTVAANRDIFVTIIPFFQAHQLQSASKRKNFELFCKIASLVQQGVHLKAEGVERIRRLKVQMNQRTIGLA